jgi:sugar-phosphatase
MSESTAGLSPVADRCISAVVSSLPGVVRVWVSCSSSCMAARYAAGVRAACAPGQTGAMTTLTCRAIVFDMDGTLVDSTAVVERIWGDFAGEHDLDVVELLAFAHGRQTHDTVRRFLPHLADAEARALVDDLQAVEAGRRDGTVEIPGAAAFVSGLPADRVALVTSANLDLARSRMREAGVALPDVVLASEHVPVGKPAPDGYLLAAELLGVDPGDVVVFEDAGAGLEAARASGASVVVVGGHDGPAAEGLPRVTGYHDVTVRAGGDGELVLTLP